MMNDAASLRVDRQDDVAIIRVLGEIDVSNAQMFAAPLADALADHRSGVVIDLSETQFVDSAGVRLLLITASTTQSRGGKVAIACAPGSKIRRVIEITGLSEIAPVFDSVDAAVSGVQS